MADNKEIHARAAAIIGRARAKEVALRAARERQERLERELIMAWLLHSGQVDNLAQAREQMLREKAWMPGWAALVGKAYQYFDLVLLEEEDG